jgi:hypothetical protein
VADAITFAIGELPSPHLDLGEARFGGSEMPPLQSRQVFTRATYRYLISDDYATYEPTWPMTEPTLNPTSDPPPEIPDPLA